MAKASKKNMNISENERNRRTRNRVYMILPLVFIVISIAAVVYVLFAKNDINYTNLYIYLATGLMDAAMFLIAWEAICWVFTNDGTGRKVGIFFLFLLFLGGTVYAWIHWNKMADVSGQITSLQENLKSLALGSAEGKSISDQIDILTTKRTHLNLNIIILQLIRLVALSGSLAVSWTGSKKLDLPEE